MTKQNQRPGLISLGAATAKTLGPKQGEYFDIDNTKRLVPPMD